MIRIACAAALGLSAIVPLAPALAGGQATIIDQLFGKAEEIFRDKGFAPTGWSHQSAMAQGAKETLTIAVSKGRSYQLVGVCDTNCSDLDIQILDASGTEVDSDALEDDFPIVGATPTTSQTYTVRVTMASCSSGPCAYGVKAFAK